MISHGNRFHRRAPLAVLVLLALALGSGSSQAVAGQAPGLELEAGSSGPLEASPDRRVTVAFRASNTGPDSLALRERIQLPAGWRLVAPPRARTIAPRSRRVLLLVVGIPSRVPPGPYEIGYSLLSDASPPTTLATASGRLIVRPETRLDGRMMNVPARVTAGESYRVRFRVTNSGNVRVRGRVELEPHGLEARLSKPEMDLEPGESDFARVTVETGIDRAREWRHVLVARLTSLRSGSLYATATSRVPVVPRSGKRGSADRSEVESEITLRSTRTAGEVAPLEVRGSGPVPLGEGGRLSYLLRGPGASWGPFGLADQYRASLTTRGMDLTLGDQLYQLSTLTEPGRYGLGGAVTARLDRWSLGVLSSFRRRGGAQEPELGGFVGFAPTGDTGLRLNYLRKNTRPEATQMVSAEGDVRLGRAAALSFELGRSFRARDVANAHSVELLGDLPGFSYRLSRLRADLGYPSSVGGVTQNGLRLSTEISSILQLDGFVNDYRVEGRAGPGDPLGESASSRFRRVGGRMGLGSAVSIEVDRTLRSSRVRTRRTRVRSDAVEVHTAWRAGSHRVQVDGEIGRIVDLARGGSHDFQRLNLRGTVGHRKQARLVVGVEGFIGHRIFRERKEESVRGFIEASLRPRRGLEVGLSGQARWHLDRKQLAHGLLRARIDYRLPFGHRVGLRSRLPVGSTLGAFGEPEMLAEYTVPFGVSLDERSPSTLIEGRVYDVADGRGLATVGVRVADRSVTTDEDGYFEVRGLSPGRHYLRLRSSTLDQGSIPVDPMPYDVLVESGSTELRLGVARAGRISGRVAIAERRYDEEGRPAEADSIADQALGNALVVLTGNPGTLRMTTDDAGRFSFDRLPPGSWRISVRVADLPPHYSLEPSRREIALEPGEEVDLRFTARPETRRIRIIDEQAIDAEP